MATLKLIRASLILSGEKLNSQFIFKNQLNCSSLNGSLQILSNMGRGFIGYTPKHASTLFKLAMRSLPLQDRFLSQLPLPPCSMCKNGPDSPSHHPMWSSIKNLVTGLQLKWIAIKRSSLKAWLKPRSQNRISPRAHYAVQQPSTRTNASSH